MQTKHKKPQWKASKALRCHEMCLNASQRLFGKIKKDLKKSKARLVAEINIICNQSVDEANEINKSCAMLQDVRPAKP